MMDDLSEAFLMTAKITQPWTQTRAHSHQQALQMVKSTVLTSLAVWDSYETCLSLWLHADSTVCACTLMASFSAAGSCSQGEALNTH